MTNPIETIHLIFKTHLDVGFTDLPHNVVQKYLHEYIPGAIATARALRQQGDSDRYIWTTGSWLVYEGLEQTEGRASLEQAIADGDIAWHALPFTAYSELMDASLYRYSLSLSKRLDQRFGKHTLAAKKTDVPGDTRASIHLLAEAGIQFLHIGVNPATPVPDVPPVFIWRDPQGAEITVAYQGSYGDLLSLPGSGSALYFAFTNDNLGPHTPADVRRIYADLRSQYPGARIQASTLSGFASEISPAVKDRLPVVTAEIGNSWIHGADRKSVV
jgi:hypothetical protein